MSPGTGNAVRGSKITPGLGRPAPALRAVLEQEIPAIAAHSHEFSPSYRVTRDKTTDFRTLAGSPRNSRGERRGPRGAHLEFGFGVLGK